jgi:hypothetical protein
MKLNGIWHPHVCASSVGTTVETAHKLYQTLVRTDI